MKIKSDASQEELSSPFYKINKEFCSVFETYIASKNGMIKGKYNAWSYAIFGKIESRNKWDLMYKKSTYTSSGNLFLSSKKQSLLTMAIWSTRLTVNENEEFSIRSRTTTDSLKMIFTKNISILEIESSYIVKTNTHLSKEVSNILMCITSLFRNKNIFHIELKNKNLKIELRTEEHHLDVFEKIINL